MNNNTEELLGELKIQIPYGTDIQGLSELKQVVVLVVLRGLTDD